jgi:hypothetical protein
MRRKSARASVSGFRSSDQTMKPIGIAIVVAQSFASINLPEASTWAMMLFGFGRRKGRARYPRKPRRSGQSASPRGCRSPPSRRKDRGSQPGGRLLARVAVCRLAQFWPGSLDRVQAGTRVQWALARDQARAIGVATRSVDRVQFRVDNRMVSSGVRIRSACPAQQAGR